jgi:imidazolonepropionase-like amidohydrolase
MRIAVALAVIVGCASGKAYAPLRYQPPAAGLAYTHARVFDARGERWLSDHTVVILGSTITAVGPSNTTAIPAGSEVIDLTGKALLPGLIDLHAHLNPRSGELHIASGVTTIRELGNDEDAVDAYRARFDAGTAIGPHVVRFVRIEGTGPKALRTKVTASSREEALSAVERFAARGYDGVKIYHSVDPALVPIIVDAAHARGMKVTGHVPAGMIADDVIAAGYDGIEHINMVALNFVGSRETDTRDLSRFTVVGERGGSLDLASPAVRDTIAKLRARGVVVTPTYAVLERMFTAKPGTIAAGQAHHIARLPMAVQQRHARARLAIDDAMLPAYRAAWVRLLALGKRLHDGGVHVAIGSDSTAGLMLYRELELFVEAGFPAATTLALATLGNARALGLERVIGSIEPGKRADLVVVAGDPIANIRDIAKIVSTMRAGVVFASAPLYVRSGVRP